MLPYLFVLFISVTIFLSHSFLKDRFNYITAIIWCIIMSVFVGLQDGVGADNEQYSNLMYANVDLIFDYFTRFLITMCKWLNLPASTIPFTFTFISYLFMSLFLMQYHKDYRVIGVALIFSNIFFIQSFNVIRQLAAVSVFLYGCALFIRGKNISYFFFVFASTIHLTAIVAFCILLISSLFRVNKFLLGLYCVSLMLFFSGWLVGFMQNSFAMFTLFDSETHYGYLQDIEASAFTGVGLQFLLNIMYAAILYRNKECPIIKNNKRTIVCFFIGLIIYNLLAIDVTLFRMAYYFYLFVYVSVPLLVESIYYKNRRLVACGLVSLYIFQFVLIMKGNNSFFPYSNVLF